MNSTQQPTQSTDKWATLFLVCWGVFILGSHVLSAGPYSVDLAELTLCAWNGGVPHSPGYPLWTRLGELVLGLQNGADPIHALGRLGVLFVILSSVITKDFLQRLGVGIWAATGAAGLLMVVPLCIRAFSIPEVYALDILLLSTTIWCNQRGHTEDHNGWTALGVVTAVLAIGHRPINVVLLLMVGIAWPHFRKRSKGLAIGLGLGLVMQGLLYLDLWNRIHNPATAWVDEHALPSVEGFLRFVVGLPFEKFFIWVPADAHVFERPLQLGLQVTVLVFATLLAPLVFASRRVGWMFLVMAGWHLLFIAIYRVADREFLFLPLIWMGVVCVGLTIQILSRRYQTHIGKAFLVGAFLFSIINERGLVKTGHEQWRQDLRLALSSVPENAIVLSDDWPARTGLTLIRELDGVGEEVDVVRISLEGGDIQRLDEWFDKKAPLVLLEERNEISAIRPIRVHDRRLIPLLIERGLVTSPAEGGTWSVVKSSTE